MSEDITLIERPIQHALSISETVGTMKLGKVMGPAYQEIMESLKKQNIPMGEKEMPFTKYNRINWDKLNNKGILAMIDMMFFHKWDMDIGIPCPESARAEGRSVKMTLEGGKFLRALHQGPYMKVGDTYKKIRGHAVEHGFELKDYSIEFYLNDPRETPAPELKTEVLVPVL